MKDLKKKLADILIAFVFTICISVVCNKIGYKFSLLQSIPGLLILAIICLIGYILYFIIPFKKISAVFWISIIGILAASPISPFSKQVIFHVNNISFHAIVTPILAYAGVIIGKDWPAFKKVGFKGIIVSIFVIAGTFFVSALLGDFFMNIFS